MKGIFDYAEDDIADQGITVDDQFLFVDLDLWLGER
jgi:hypothetical protein